MYQCINADSVYEGEISGHDKLSGMINFNGEATSDVVVGYFAYFKLLNGFEKTFYMTKEQVEDWANNYSPSSKSSYSPWKKEFDKMAIKTVLRRLLGTYGVMSTELIVALSSDDEETKVKKEIDANANKQPMDFKDVEYEIDPEPVSNEPSEAEKARILADELAAAEADYGQPSFA